jgi:hypothetical protein
MFLGRTEEARALYLKYKDRKSAEDASWNEIIQGHFASLEMRAEAHPLMAEIKNALSAAPKELQN